MGYRKVRSLCIGRGSGGWFVGILGESRVFFRCDFWDFLSMFEFSLGYRFIRDGIF